MLLSYSSLEAFHKKNKLCIWCKSSSATGTCRTETWHQHNKQWWTSTRWLLHQIDNHDSQFRNYSFTIYVIKLENNMKKKTHLAQKSSSSTRKQNSRSGHAVMIKIISVIPDHALRVHLLSPYSWLSSVNLYMAVAFQVAMVT